MCGTMFFNFPPAKRKIFLLLFVNDQAQINDLQVRTTTSFKSKVKGKGKLYLARVAHSATRLISKGILD